MKHVFGLLALSLAFFGGNLKAEAFQAPIFCQSSPNQEIVERFRVVMACVLEGKFVAFDESQLAIKLMDRMRNNDVRLVENQMADLLNAKINGHISQNVYAKKFFELENKLNKVMGDYFRLKQQLPKQSSVE